ncbi:MAG: alpha/beta fold hydrolase, partial [Spirochaetales bacterium]|nr:alpha/beta fold hydrolase [Spirochaetales bacterium]
PWYMQSGMAQTLLNSAKFRNRGTGDFENNCREKIIDAGSGIRLQGFLSEQPSGAKGLVILLHGWEGSERSAYMVSTGRSLYRNGFNVFRLNMRDHGTSHHLNKGFFLGTLIDEAYGAVKEIIRLYSPDGQGFLAGFSMGANFSIRVAKRASEESWKGLKQIFAVNPPVDPFDSTRRVDETPLIRGYFLKKWKKSLEIKQELFPELYDFSSILTQKECIPMTDLLLKKYTDFGSLKEYFGHYTLKKGWLEDVTLPLTLLTSEDDPIIPSADIAAIEKSPAVRFILQKRGGHCGYLMNRRLESWYLPLMLQTFRTP